MKEINFERLDLLAIEDSSFCLYLQRTELLICFAKVHDDNTYLSRLIYSSL